MSIATVLSLIIIGVAAGVMSSLVGIGGGLLIVPGLVLACAMSQKMAQGTSLALMLPPIGFFAVVNYYKAGYVDFKVAAVLCVAFVAGSYFGSKFALKMDELTLKRLFGAFLAAMAVKLLFFSR